MKLERLQSYKAQLAATPSSQWGEILFRLVNEAKGPVRVFGPDAKPTTQFDLETTKMKLTMAIGALEAYADPGSFKEGESIEEITHLAKVTLNKIEKVNWLQANRPAELG